MRPRKGRMTVDALLAVEPRLMLLQAKIKDHAKEHCDDDPYCANAYWYGYFTHGMGFKGEMKVLVGQMRAADPEAPAGIETSDAYSTMYSHLYDLLPDCRGDCACSEIF